MADNPIDLGIHQLLGNDGALLRIRLIIFGQQFKLDLGAPDFHPFRVQLLDGQHGAILVVLAQMGLRTGHWGNVAELDHDFRLGFCCRGGRGGLNFLLATSGKCEGGCYGEGNYGKLGLHIGGSPEQNVED